MKLTWACFCLTNLTTFDRRALVSSKTKVSKEVYTLHLEKEALMRCSDAELTWRVIKFHYLIVFFLKRF